MCVCVAKAELRVTGHACYVQLVRVVYVSMITCTHMCKVYLRMCTDVHVDMHNMPTSSLSPPFLCHTSLQLIPSLSPPQEHTEGCSEPSQTETGVLAEERGAQVTSTSESAGVSVEVEAEQHECLPPANSSCSEGNGGDRGERGEEEGCEEETGMEEECEGERGVEEEREGGVEHTGDHVESEEGSDSSQRVQCTGVAVVADSRSKLPIPRSE